GGSHSRRPLEDPEYLPRDRTERRPAIGCEVATGVALERANRTFGMKVIVEGREDILCRGVVLDRAQPATTQRFGERVRASARARQPVPVVVKRAPVMDIEAVKPQGLRPGLLQR